MLKGYHIGGRLSCRLDGRCGGAYPLAVRRRGLH